MLTGMLLFVGAVAATVTLFVLTATVNEARY